MKNKFKKLRTMTQNQFSFFKNPCKLILHCNKGQKRHARRQRLRLLIGHLSSPLTQQIHDHMGLGPHRLHIHNSSFKPVSSDAVYIEPGKPVYTNCQTYVHTKISLALFGLHWPHNTYTIRFVYSYITQLKSNVSSKR